MRVIIFISVVISQVMGFMLSRSANTVSFSSKYVQKGFVRSIQLQVAASDDTPQWMIEGGDTSETECSSSGDIKRAAAAAAAKEVAAKEAAEAEAKAKAFIEAARVLREENEKKAADETKRLAAVAEAEKKIVPSTEVVQSATIPGPKVDLTKLSVGTDSFDVGLLIAFPIIVATLGFFFLFPLIGPQLASTLPPVPPM